MIDLRPTTGPRLALELLASAEGLAVRLPGEAGAPSSGEALALQPLDEVLSMLAQPTFHEAIGRGLFRALCAGAVGDRLRAALAEAGQAGGPLTLEIHFGEGALHAASYPWELLHDGARFLLHAGALTLVRCVPAPSIAARAPRAGEPLTLLVITAFPSERGPFRSQWPALNEALAPWVAADRVDLATLLPPTWDSLREWVLAGAPDILHLESPAARGPEAGIVLESASGASDPVSADLLGALLGGSRLRLAVWTGAGAVESALSGGFAPALIQAGLPAVVALPVALPSDPPGLTGRFVKTLYTALFDGAPLETAFEQARRTLNRSAAWQLPMLYRQVAQAMPDSDVLTRRVDLITPRHVEAQQPARAGLWLVPPGAPPPDPATVQRLLGCSPEECVPEAPGAVVTLHAGLVQVEVEAEGCELHGDHASTLVVTPDQEATSTSARPLWFALTPRRSGPVNLRLTLRQEGQAVATVARTLQTAGGPANAPAAQWSLSDLLSEHAPTAQTAPSPAPFPEPAPAEPSASSAPPEPEPVPVRVPVEITRLRTAEVPVVVMSPWRRWLIWGAMALALIALVVIVMLLAR